MKPQILAKTEIYPALYRDRHGEEHTSITNDGGTLRMRARGVEFSGVSFDSLEAPPDIETALRGRFCVNDGDLCDCVIECEMTQNIVAFGEAKEAILHVVATIGKPAPNGGVDGFQLRLALHYGEREYASSGRSGYFEEELLEMQAALPQGVYMQNCFGCAWSDYCPGGGGSFGSLLCFCKEKATYSAVKNKFDLLNSGLLSTSNPHTEAVQETHCCPEFERRRPNTGYRG